MGTTTAPVSIRGIVTVVRSLPWAWVILLSMSTQGYLFLSPFPGFLPFELGANFFGFLGATPIFLFFPAIVTSVLGIVGMVTSWPFLLQEFLSAHTDEDFVDGVLNTFLCTVIPFYSKIAGETNEVHEAALIQRQIYGPNQSDDDELWIYINGVATPQAIAFQNCVMLNELFHHKVTAVHNVTNSVIVDLYDCVRGKLFSDKHCLEARRVLKGKLTKALKSSAKKKIVLIAHSQGTIITSNALSELYKENDASILRQMQNKLEVYNFANCAHQLPPASAFKHIEHINNRGDVVAWLGALFPLPKLWKDHHGEVMSLEGDMVIEPRLWGHMLNSHYLRLLKKGYYNSSKIASYLVHEKSGALVTARKSNSPERTYATLT